MNGSKQLHSPIIQLVHHNRECTVKHAHDSTEQTQGALCEKWGADNEKIRRESFFEVATLGASSIGLSGCVYGVGLGYASDGYYKRAIPEVCRC